MWQYTAVGIYQMLLTQKFIFMSLTFLYNYIFIKICVKKRNLIGISLLLLQIGQNIICIIFKKHFFSLNNHFNLFSYIT